MAGLGRPGLLGRQLLMVGGSGSPRVASLIGVMSAFGFRPLSGGPVPRVSSVPTWPSCVGGSSLLGMMLRALVRRLAWRGWGC